MSSRNDGDRVASGLTPRFAQRISAILFRTGAVSSVWWKRTPDEVRMNHTKTPQFGHGASPGGWDGSTQIKASQTGQ